MGSAQDLGTLASPDNAVMARLVIGGLIAVALLVFIFKSADFRKSFDNLFAGVLVGLAVLGAWYVTSNIKLDVDGDIYSLREFAQQWDFLAESDEGKPADTRPLSPQSFTFINPMGQALGYTSAGFSVIAGSFLWSLMSRSFRFEWFASGKDFLSHVIGGILMGFGGVLAMGCTIGQGITGFSTLAIGSFIALISIIFGCALTMKIQYYKLVYEEEATFFKALVTSLVDMKLLPSGLRSLDAV